ncbi:MAG TPA: polysaccharide deacetylase family protein [Thermomicrobiales bacterium]|jgi:peptidoglycan/xylan/chitin deacetylase (PgdA/CDA1 family)
MRSLAIVVTGLAVVLAGLSPSVRVSTASARDETAVAASATPDDAADLEPTATETPTATPTEPPTPTDEPTATPTLTPEPPATPTLVPTPIPTASEAPPVTATPSPTARPPTSTPTPTRRATRTPTPGAGVGVAELAPTCTLSTTGGVIGQSITVTCQGFGPGSGLRIRWQGIAETLARFTAADDGSGSKRFAVPAVAAGSWQVTVVDGAGVKVVTTFRVRPPSLGLSPASGQAGAAVTVRLRGFRAGEVVVVRWYSYSGATSSVWKRVTVASSGKADAKLTVPVSSGHGGHRISAVGQTSGLSAGSVFSVVGSGQIRYLDQGASGCKRIAFIFNVGIGDRFDTGVLATLKGRGVPATMFVMGWWAERNGTLLNRLAADGYVIGSHGYARRELTTQSDANVVKDIQRAGKAIEQVLGAPPGPWFTPYAAAIDGRVVSLIVGQGYLPVGWRIAARDYDETAYEADVYRRVVGNAYDGAIVEFHIDGPATARSTGRALPRIIDNLRGRGYRFVTIPQMAVACSAVAAQTALAAAPVNAEHAAVLAERRESTRRRRRRSRGHRPTPTHDDRCQRARTRSKQGFSGPQTSGRTTRGTKPTLR